MVQTADLTRARKSLGYPYRMPTDSYVLEGPSRHIIPQDELDAFCRSNTEALDLGKWLHWRGVDRLPVIAYGANRIPTILQKKLTGSTDQTIPVLKCTLVDVDVVYSAHVTTSGIVPATLRQATGTVSSVAVTLLSESQLPFIHASESIGENYCYAKLQATAQLETGATIRAPFAYLSTRGCLARDGAPIALKAIHAQRRSLCEATERELMHSLAQRLAPDRTVEEFVVTLSRSDEVRSQVTNTLLRQALPSELSFSVVEC
jgi:hypothetical protein